jgi:hypothetical protein
MSLTSEKKMAKCGSFTGTSIQLFRAYIFSLPNGGIDASKIHSRRCYEDWLANRNTQPTDSELRKFQRALSNHVAGVDGRSPFFPEEERAILQVMREKRTWPCCEPGQPSIGRSGYRSMGYHEKLAEELFPTSKKQKVTGLLKTCSSASIETEAACSEEEAELEFPTSFSAAEIALESYDLPGLMEYPCSEEELLKGWLPASMYLSG